MKRLFGTTIQKFISVFSLSLSPFGTKIAIVPGAKCGGSSAAATLNSGLLLDL